MVTLGKPDSLAGSKSPAAVSVSNSNLTAEERFLCHKTELHQRLIRGMDLSAIAQLSEEELRLEVRHAAQELCRHSSDLLTMGQQERLVNEVIDETFGLGPLEGLFADPTISDILINGPKTVYVERQGRLEQSTPRSDRPAHRGTGRTTGGRNHPHGGRALAGWKPD